MANSYKVSEYKEGERLISFSFIDYPLDELSIEKIISKVKEVMERELTQGVF